MSGLLFVSDNKPRKLNQKGELIKKGICRPQWNLGTAVLVKRRNLVGGGALRKPCQQDSLQLLSSSVWCFMASHC